MNPHHQLILKQIKTTAGSPTQHTFSNSYMGTAHPRYPLNNAAMRGIAKDFIKTHPLEEKELVELLTSLIEGKSFTEKSIAGFMLDYAGKKRWGFDPAHFDNWLNHLEGWAEIDTLCTGKYSAVAIPSQFASWEKLLTKFSKSDLITKRRASIVLCVVSLRKKREEKILKVVFQNIKRLQSEKDVLITKAVSWVLRSATPYHKKEVKQFVTDNQETLPKIAVRETLTKLKTGKKTRANSTIKKSNQ